MAPVHNVRERGNPFFCQPTIPSNIMVGWLSRLFAFGLPLAHTIRPGSIANGIPFDGSYRRDGSPVMHFPPATVPASAGSPQRPGGISRQGSPPASVMMDPLVLKATCNIGNLRVFVTLAVSPRSTSVLG
jgi:hypothetical protein